MFFFLACVATPAAHARGFSPQDSPDQLKSHFDKEPNPVRRAKLLVKLGDAQFQQVRADADAGKPEDGLKNLELIRDECTSTHDALKAKGGDPESKSSGFKELQITVRETLHRLRELMAGLGGDDQKHYAQVRAQLEDLDNELVRELFPRQSNSATKPSPKP